MNPKVSGGRTADGRRSVSRTQEKSRQLWMRSTRMVSLNIRGRRCLDRANIFLSSPCADPLAAKVDAKADAKASFEIK